MQNFSWQNEEQTLDLFNNLPPFSINFVQSETFNFRSIRKQQNNNSQYKDLALIYCVYS